MQERHKPEYYIGKTINCLTILNIDHTKSHIRPDGSIQLIRYVNCKCSCGNIVTVRLNDIISGRTKSCGHLNIEQATINGKNNKKHGMSDTHIYRVWSSIIDRCYRENATNYDNYGKKGVGMYKPWRDDFMEFYNWAISHGWYEQPKDTPLLELLTIERLDINGDYEPDNCTWIPFKYQAKNRSTNVFFDDYDKDRLILEDVSTKYNTTRATVAHRLDRGWSKDEILFHLRHPEYKINKGKTKNLFRLVDEDGFGTLIPTVTNTFLKR